MTTTSSVDDDPRVAVNQLVVSLALLQFLWIVELEGVCTKTLLAEMTGLSKSRIAQGNLDAIRPSTQARMEQTALQWARERAEDPAGRPRFTRLDSLAELPAWIDRINAGAG